MQNLIIRKKRRFFLRKLSKIAENLILTSTCVFQEKRQRQEKRKKLAEALGDKAPPKLVKPQKFAYFKANTLNPGEIRSRDP
jgi:hypothetical protein